MFIRIGVLLALSIFLVRCSTADKSINNEKAAFHLQLGTTYLLKGAYPQALKELLAADTLNPNDPVIQNNLGLAYLVRDKIDDAENRFKKSLSLSPQYTDARNNLGRLYMNIGLFDKALKELEIACADLTYEQPEKSWANLGQTYFLSGQFDKAKSAFQRSLKSRNDSCFTMNFYGRTLFELKNYRPASESLDKAVRLCAPVKFDEPHFYGGLSYFKLGNHEHARARFNELIQLFPESKYVTRAKEMLEIIK